MIQKVQARKPPPNHDTDNPKIRRRTPDIGAGNGAHLLQGLDFETYGRPRKGTGTGDIYDNGVPMTRKDQTLTSKLPHGKPSRSSLHTRSRQSTKRRPVSKEQKDFHLTMTVKMGAICSLQRSGRRRGSSRQPRDQDRMGCFRQNA